MGLVTFQEGIGFDRKVRCEGSVEGPILTVRDVRRLVPRRVGTTRDLVRSLTCRTIDQDLDTRQLWVIETGHESRIDRMVTSGCVFFVAVVFYFIDPHRIISTGNSFREKCDIFIGNGRTDI